MEINDKKIKTPWDKTPINDTLGENQGQSEDDNSENISVEKEIVNTAGEESITVPFDPTKIDVDIANVNLGSLIEEIEDGVIDLKPDFQRASDVWDKVKKSRLIESILLRLPLPSFYFSEDPNTKKLAIIDGLQRICAIRDFVIEKTLKLENLQFLESFNGKTYEDLSRPEQRSISALKITKNTLRKDTPNDVKYVIFQRVNTAGVPLEPQEMRHALNQGQASLFVERLSQIEEFKIATNYSVKSKRMQDRDFANRFIAFYLGFKEYNGELDVFLNEKMGALNKMSSAELFDIEDIFKKSMQCCYDIFGDDTFRRRKNIYDRRKPISKAVYDTISVNIAWLSNNERSILVDRANDVRNKMMELFNNEKFNRSISTGTGHPYSVEIRFNEVKMMLKEILEYDNEDKS